MFFYEISSLCKVLLLPKTEISGSESFTRWLVVQKCWCKGPSLVLRTWQVTNVFSFCFILTFCFVGAILDGEESMSAMRMAVEYVNERNILGPSHTLTYLLNNTQIIATTESIQLGNYIYLHDS